MEPEKIFSQERFAEMLISPEVMNNLKSRLWKMVVIQPQERLDGWSRERVGEQMEYFRSHLEQMEVWEYFFVTRNEFVLLTMETQKGVSEDYLILSLNRMLQAIMRDRKICFTAGISAGRTGVEGKALAEAYREAMLAVCGRLLGGSGKAYSYEQPDL